MVSRPLALELGARYALTRRSAISFISFVAVAGLALSVAVLVVVVSVINGMERELKDRVFGMLPHLTLYGREPIEPDSDAIATIAALPDVEGAVPLIQQAGLAAVSDRVTGVLITGIGDDYGNVSDLYQYLEGGSGALQAGAFEIFLGAGVAKTLGVGVGDRVSIVLPSATVTPAGLFPRQKRFLVQGIVRSRSEIDGRAAYVHEADARRLLRLGQRVHGYQIRLTDLFGAESVARQAMSTLDDRNLFPRSWMRTHGNLYHAIGVQKTTMFVLLSFLVGVAAFNLISTLVMVVDQRRSDVAILRTLGSDSRTVVWAFLLLGTTLGLIGIAAGLAVGVLVSQLLPGFYLWLTDTLAVDLMSQYFVNYLPVEVRLADLLGISVTALVLSMLSTLYPAWRAARLKPSEVLAHE
ncbi:MAG: lipoprotein-releasing ABC transporter permease subunit [Gammaproteobacteria bacterium]|nr:MAG: lipoprotein-releasing ABC transporter permease subunit [Gammaproteobacteria bacterium]